LTRAVPWWIRARGCRRNRGGRCTETTARRGGRMEGAALVQSGSAPAGARWRQGDLACGERGCVDVHQMWDGIEARRNGGEVVWEQQQGQGGETHRYPARKGQIERRRTNTVLAMWSPSTIQVAPSTRCVFASVQNRCGWGAQSPNRQSAAQGMALCNGKVQAEL
jgi:hypothetical protein